MYNCEDIFEKTDAYLDGELSELEYAEFEKHLESCEACRNSVEYAKKLNKVMHGMPSVEPPADFLDNLHKKIAAEGKAVKFYKKWQPYGALAACLVLAIVIRTNAVKDLNESSSYLNMTTPAPTAELAEATVYTAKDEIKEMSDAEAEEYIFNEVSPTTEPVAKAVVPEVSAAPIQAEQTAEPVTKTDYVQPIPETSAVSEAAVTAAPAEKAAAVEDVPMMLSLPTDEADISEKVPAPQAPSEGYGGNTVLIGDNSTNSTSVRAGGSASSGAASVSGSGASASTGSWISAYTVPPPNYINSEHRAEVEAIIASLGIQKDGEGYAAEKAVFEQFKAALAEKNISFDGMCAENDGSVHFVIEWE